MSGPFRDTDEGWIDLLRGATRAVAVRPTGPSCGDCGGPLTVVPKWGPMCPVCDRSVFPQEGAGNPLVAPPCGPSAPGRDLGKQVSAVADEEWSGGYFGDLDSVRAVFPQVGAANPQVTPGRLS